MITMTMIFQLLKSSVELPNPEECDATDDDSSTTAWLQNFYTNL